MKSKILVIICVVFLWFWPSFVLGQEADFTNKEIEEILQREYKDSITVDEGLKLCLRILNKILDKNFSVERIDAAYIKTSDRKFTKLSKKELDRVVKDVKKK